MNQIAQTTTTTTTTYSAQPMSEINSSSSGEEAARAMAGVYGAAAVGALSNVIAARPDIPQAKAEQLYDSMSAALERSGVSANASAASNQLMDVLIEAIENNAQDFVSGAEEQANKSGGQGGGNWLVALAKAMGEVAGAHLERMVQLSNEITQVSGGDIINTDGLTGDALASAQDQNTTVRSNEAREMAALTAEMQAESQMFKMAQEMTTTVVKNIGEALHSTSRKQ